MRAHTLVSQVTNFREPRVQKLADPNLAYRYPSLENGPTCMAVIEPRHTMSGMPPEGGALAAIGQGTQKNAAKSLTERIRPLCERALLCAPVFLAADANAAAFREVNRRPPTALTLALGTSEPSHWRDTPSTTTGC